MKDQFRYMTVTKEQLGKLDAGQWCVVSYCELAEVYWVAKPESADQD